MYSHVAQDSSMHMDKKGVESALQPALPYMRAPSTSMRVSQPPRKVFVRVGEPSQLSESANASTKIGAEVALTWLITVAKPQTAAKKEEARISLFEWIC